MAHNPYEVMISLSLDGMLTPEEENELEQHLQACATCTDLQERMKTIDMLFAAPPAMAPAVDLTASIMGRIDAYETRRRWQPWVIGVLIVASLVAALNIAAPVIFFSLGLNQTVADWPIVVRAAEALLSAFVFVQGGAELAYDWLVPVVTEPVALGVVLTALVMASTWIGMLEVSKVQRMARAGQEA